MIDLIVQLLRERSGRCPNISGGGEPATTISALGDMVRTDHDLGGRQPAGVELLDLGINQFVPQPNVAAIDRALRPYLDAIRDDLNLLDYAAGDLARQWDIEESVIRAAQAIMRKRDGTRDESLVTRLKKPRVTSIGKADVGDAAGTKERNDVYAERGHAMALEDPELMAHRANSRNYKPLLWTRGIDIGTAVSYRQSEFGPGQAVIRDSLRGLSQTNGYNAARDLQDRSTVALQRALNGLTKQVLSGRDSALSAFGVALGGSSVRCCAPRAALTGPARATGSRGL